MLESLRRLLPRELLFGEVLPRRPPPARSHQPIDGRTAALRVLREYLTAIVFYAPGAVGSPPVAFRVLEENFHLETPDAVQDQKYPSITVLGVPAKYSAAGFVPVVEESTRDRFGPGTALQRHQRYEETVALEVWASTEPELRSILAGLETAFNPTEGRAGLLLRMREYYEVTARFLLVGRESVGDNSSAIGRRHAKVLAELDFHNVSLVRVAPLQPQVDLSVGYDPQTGLPLDLEATPGAHFVVPSDAVDARRRHRRSSG
jgi:hypothetical protein